MQNFLLIISVAFILSARQVICAGCIDESSYYKGTEPPDQLAALDVESLVAMALDANPSIKQAQAAIAKAAAIRCQVGLKPNPELGYFGQEIGNDGSAGQQGVYVSRSIVRGDKLAWSRKVISHDIERLKWEAEAQRQRVETDVRVRFFRALTAQKKLETARQFLAAATKAVGIAEQKLDAGEGTRPDLMQSQILVEQIDLSVREFEFQWQAAWKELAATVGDVDFEPVPLSGQLLEAQPLDRDQLYEKIEFANPLVHAATVQIDRAKSNWRRHCQQGVPNVNAQFGVAYDEATGNTFANIQLGVPIPANNGNQGNIRAAKAEYTSAVQNLERLRLRLRRDLAEPIRRYETAVIRVSRYQAAIIPKAKKSLELIEKAQGAGEVEFLRVLTARQNYFELTQQLIDARGILSEVDCELRGCMLADSLGTQVTYDGDDGLRGRALSGQ